MGCPRYIRLPPVSDRRTGIAECLKLARSRLTLRNVVPLGIDRRNRPVLNFDASFPIKFDAVRGLLRQILVEERRQLAEVLLRLGRAGIAGILSMRLALEHVEISDDVGLTQLAMHAYRVGQEQVTRARCENGRRENRTGRHRLAKVADPSGHGRGGAQYESSRSAVGRHTLKLTIVMAATLLSGIVPAFGGGLKELSWGGL
jgi:hypothetical protein